MPTVLVPTTPSSLVSQSQLILRGLFTTAALRLVSCARRIVGGENTSGDYNQGSVCLCQNLGTANQIAGII